MFPDMTDEPVLVIVEPASTAKVDAEPRLTVVVAATAAPVPNAATVRKQSELTARAPKPTRPRE